MEDHQEQEIHYWGATPETEYYQQNRITGSKSFYTSPRGLKLFTRSWLPISDDPPRGVICMVHGYGNDISWTFQSTAIFLAQMGFACFAADVEGHGRSDGTRCYVPHIDLVVQDLMSFFDRVKSDPNLSTLPRFLYGESMGGAIALLTHFSDPVGFDGAILVAPMCKISDKAKPKWPIDKILTLIAKIAPILPIVPTEDLIHKSIKVAEKIPVAQSNPYRYRGKPRLGSVVELLRVTDYLEKRMSDVTVPFLVVHGSDDAVTDPDVSRALYESAKSEDKTIKIYEGMMHSLLFGETDENIEMVRNDIFDWLDKRCLRKMKD